MKKILSLPALLVVATFGLASLFADETNPSNPPEVAYPEGYRDWHFVSSVVLPRKEDSANSAATGSKPALTSGLIHNVYANEKAREGLRTGHFAEGSVLIADWFVLEAAGPVLVQGPRKSINVMVRDARYTSTGGWGFEDFDKDSRTIRNVGQTAVKSCFECHRRAEDREYVFSSLKP
ncbi:MAG TPA: cytochrome P460 family protein [Opitutaceae bacterium]|nr:cytochrome P460 family protein [Opitutaceae bacterium]